VSAHRWAGVVAGCALVLLGAARPPLAAPKTDPKAEAWTPDRVRRFVIGVERLMERLYQEQEDVEHPDLAGHCRGYSMGAAIRRSAALSRMRPFIGDKVIKCYLATYLGCDAGDWIGRPEASEVGPELQAFKRSRVTIIEQTPDRVVADVTEISPEAIFGGDAAEYMGEDDLRPYSDAEVAAIQDASRYTITRGKGGLWQITDRKPSFKWSCDGGLDHDPEIKISR
jgi:hypothetical protein